MFNNKDLTYNSEKSNLTLLRLLLNIYIRPNKYILFPFIIYYFPFIILILVYLDIQLLGGNTRMNTHHTCCGMYAYRNTYTICYFINIFHIEQLQKS